MAKIGKKKHRYSVTDLYEKRERMIKEGKTREEISEIIGKMNDETV